MKSSKGPLVLKQERNVSAGPRPESLAGAKGAGGGGVQKGGKLLNLDGDIVYPTLFFGGRASRAGAGRPGTLACRRWGRSAAVCCVSGGGVPRDKLII